MRTDQGHGDRRENCCPGISLRNFRHGSATSFALFRVGGSIWFCLHPRFTAKPKRSLIGRRPGRSAGVMPPPPALLG
jgi:hypothetical protein